MQIKLRVCMTDRHGEEHLRGDILRLPRDRYYYSVHCGVAGFGLSLHREDGVFATTWNYRGGGEVGEVVGNIYQDAELLERGA